MKTGMPRLLRPVRTASLIWMSILLSSQAIAQDVPANAITAWPLRLEEASGVLTVYQPQPEKFEGDMLTARAAVSLTPPGATSPEFGAIWVQARVFTDRDARTVTIQDVTVKHVKLPNSTPDQEQQFGQVLEQQVPSLRLTLSLDQLEATLGVAEKAKEESLQLQNTPPKIMFTTIPTTLVTLDGPPKLQPAEVPNVMRVINTPFIMLMDLQSKRFFLKAGDLWQTAPDVTGPWSVTNSIPPGIADEGVKLAGSPVQPAAATGQPAPAGPTQIIVSQEPAELIASDGAPAYTPLPNNDLLYMSNTQADVFMEVSSQQYYVLLSGRWYQSASLQGPWVFVASDKLPAAFAAIPPDSAKGNVLVSVAGTQPAKDAKLDAFIPQTSAIRRDSGADLSVTYDGDPQFVPVENTPISYASNCADPVLWVNNGYYCCHQAVWYQSTAATGPWIVATAIPQVIYTLPPSCPVYNCRYCYIYDSTPDLVYCGYLPGYTGCYVYGPTVVFGTGYNYPYWYHREFIPRPTTWGFGVRYDYYSGSWGLGASINFGPTWFAADHDRRNWWGPAGYVDYHAIRERREGGAFNIHDEHIAHNDIRNVTVNRIDIYNRQENTKRNVFVKNDVRVLNNTREQAHNEPARALPHEENNVYAGHDGQIYRRTNDGWEANTGKGWSQVKTIPEAPTREPARADRQERVPQVNEGPRETPAHETPERETPGRETPVHETPTRENPARETPARETPQLAPSREPSHVQAPARSEEPRRSEQPSGGGLEDEHIARERGSTGGGGFTGGGETHGGGSGNGGAAHGGGGGGGGNNSSTGGNRR